MIYLSWFAIILLSTSYWFQVWKTYITGNIEDLSFWVFVQLAVGFAILIPTGVIEGSLIFTIGYIISLIPVLIIIYQMYYYKKELKECRNCKSRVKKDWTYCPGCGVVLKSRKSLFIIS